MKNTKDTRKSILKQQFSKFRCGCYLICKNYNDNADEVYELPVNNYHDIAENISSAFKSAHNGYCTCNVIWTNGCRGVCYSI